MPRLRELLDRDPTALAGAVVGEPQQGSAAVLGAIGPAPGEVPGDPRQDHRQQRQAAPKRDLGGPDRQPEPHAQVPEAADERGQKYDVDVGPGSIARELRQMAKAAPDRRRGRLHRRVDARLQGGEAIDDRAVIGDIDGAVVVEQQA